MFSGFTNSGEIANQFFEHKGLLEIYVHLAGGFFLFASSIIAAFLLWRNFSRLRQGWFPLGVGILFIGLIGLGEAVEHFFGPPGSAGYDFFHYLHMVAAPVGLFFLYVGVNELQFLYFEVKQKRVLSNQVVYLIIFVSFLLPAFLSAEAFADNALEVTFLSVTIIPTLIIAFLLTRKSIDLYRQQDKLSLFSLSVFSTVLVLIPILALSAVGLAGVIWLGRLADELGLAWPYLSFHVLQDLFLVTTGSTMLGSAIILMIPRSIKELQDRLLKSAKFTSLGELASNIAEQLSVPLTNILGYASLLLSEEKIPSYKKKDLELIKNEASKAVRLAQDLLDVSQSAKPDFKVLSLESVLEDALALAGGRCQQGGVKINRNFQHPLPLVSVDPEQIRQVFINVINNAVDAMPHGGKLDISLFSRGDWIELDFQDTGHGIAKENLKKVFEPLFTTKASKGTGLGLSLAKTILSQHNGTVEVKSTIGLGTMVKIKLPSLKREFQESLARWP